MNPDGVEVKGIWRNGQMEKILSKDDKISEAIEVEEVTMSNKDITIRKESFIEAGNIRAENK